MPVGLPFYLALSAVLFVIGGLGVLLRRDPLVMVMAIDPGAGGHLLHQAL